MRREFIDSATKSGRLPSLCMAIYETGISSGFMRMALLIVSAGPG